MRAPRILVVDDEPGMLRAVERVLGRKYAVTAVESPLAALEAAGTLRPDLAILDIRMPELDGFELMARLREAVPGVDVILMTGSASEPDQKLVRAIRENAFYFIEKPFDSEVLRTLVERCLELRHLAEENRRHLRRLEGELTQAQAFQRGLLPRKEAILEGIELVGRYAPTSELGGDFFDYAPAGPGRAALVIADVSGHGVTAAMLTGIVKSGFWGAREERFEPVAVVEQIRSALQSFGPDQFVSLIAARLSARDESIEFVNAGHPAGLLWTPDGRIDLLHSTGPIVSPAFLPGLWQRESRMLPPGGGLLLYTDGISESRAPDDEEFGEERIVETVRTSPAGGAPLLDELLRRVRDYSAGRPQTDDLTLVTARRTGR